MSGKALMVTLWTLVAVVFLLAVLRICARGVRQLGTDDYIFGLSAVSRPWAC